MRLSTWLAVGDANVTRLARELERTLNLLNVDLVRLFAVRHDQLTDELFG